jgi:predicted phosphodiesterase
MRIIHLSDLHYKSTDGEQDKLILALCEDLRKIRAEKTIDVIVFSGDIASKGNISSNIADEIFKKVISPIQLAVGIEVPFICCPGNHDVNLKARDEIYEPIFNNVSDPEGANKIVGRDNTRLNGVLNHLDGYLELVRKIDVDAYPKNKFFYTKKIIINGISFGFASINSTWLTKGGGNADYGKLFIGEIQLDLALKEIHDCEVKIAIMHHTLNWLHPQEASIASRLLATNFQAVLCGHNHENNASSIIGNLGALFVSNTGCLYEKREYFNGYSILDLSLEHQEWVVTAREYFYQRAIFDQSLRFSEAGTSRFGMKNVPGNNLIVIPSSVITEVQERASSKLLSFSASEVAPKHVGAMFVEPLLADISEKQFVASKDASDPKFIPLDVLAIIPENLLIVGKRETGKTILLHQIAANRYIEFHHLARLGLVMDLATLSKLTEATILQQLVENAGGEIPRRHMIDLLMDGRLLICVDNLQLHSEKQVDTLKSFCLKYSKTRFIIVASEEFYDAIAVGDLTPDLGPPVRRVFLHSFRRKQIKDLVLRWFGEDGGKNTLRFEMVNQLLNRLNVPNTPFLVSVLLWVLEQRPNASPVNQAAAIEVLIDGLLEKFQENKSRSSFDSTIQKHFLSDFSVQLDLSNAEWMSAIEFDQFVVSYFQRKGLKVSTAGFAEELLKKGLLYSTVDRVAFKFDCFRAYFLAQRFLENPSLWMKALSPAEVHRYSTEIDLFTGLHRDRKDVLEAALSLCGELFTKSKFDVSLTCLDEVEKNVAILNPVGLDNLEETVLGEAYDDEKREIRLADMETPSGASVDHEEARKRSEVVETDDEISFIGALRALSIVVRNSELVDDLSLKQRGVSASIEYWSKVLLSTVSTVSLMDLKNVPGIEALGKDLTPEATKQMMIMIIPQAILAMMAECLTSPKLQVFLGNVVSSSENPVVVCLAGLTALEGGDRDAVALVKNLLQKYSKNKLIIQIVFFKLMSMYFLQYLEGNHALGVRECLTEAFLTMRGVAKREKGVYRDQFIVGLDKQMQRQALKMETDER